jgi:hypothetical protein
VQKRVGAGEEKSVMMMEDWASFNMHPTFDAVRHTRFNQ